MRPIARTGQCSGWKARATELRLCEPATEVLGCASFLLPVHVHSPCVSLRVFASSREPISPYTTDLGLESPSYLHSRSFVFHSASDGVSPLVTALTSVLLSRIRTPHARKACAGPVEAAPTPRHRHPGDLEPADSGGNECAVSSGQSAGSAGSGFRRNSRPVGRRLTASDPQS